MLNISKDKPINIGLVFDHSGSMVDNPAQMPKDVETMQDYYFYGLEMPKDYVMAIDYAKEGVLGFLEETKPSNDSILFVGFSTTVDKIYPLTNDVSGIKSFVEKVLPEGRTSFYDALFLTIENLSKGSSKSVIVALTDGQDNESKHTSQEVIDLANEKWLKVDVEGFKKAEKDHQDKSRTASAWKFKWGLADSSDETTALHSATHLLLSGLNKILWWGISQKGSNITPERLRFDFNFDRKVERDELDKIENFVNEAIDSWLDVSVENMDKQIAKDSWVEWSFWEKYPDTVKVYSMIWKNWAFLLNNWSRTSWTTDSSLLKPRYFLSLTVLIPSFLFTMA